ncbi:hypothetical protein [Orbus mooreae]|uniref:hypothetical protein n=1 Tax=Orbus mooreae TaxID=3074107 RepID=UPI00370DCF0D
MNNSMLSSNQVIDTQNRPQSLFKLPTVFAFTMVVFNILLSIFYYFQYSSNATSEYWANWYLMNLWSDRIINQMVNFFVFYFCFSLIVFIGQKFHQFTWFNVLKVVVMCIVNIFIMSLLTVGYSLLYRWLREVWEFSYSYFAIVHDVIHIIFNIVSLLVFLGVAKLVLFTTRTKQQDYTLLPKNHSTLFAALFTVIFCIPSMVLLFDRLPYVISDFLNYSIIDEFNVMMIVLLIVPALVTFLCILVNFLIIFFSAKRCFQREFTLIPLKLLFKAVGKAYLYLIGFAIVSNGVYFIISFIIASSMNSYELRPFAMFLMTIVSLAFCIINIIAIVKLVRKALTYYFSVNKVYN